MRTKITKILIENSSFFTGIDTPTPSYSFIIDSAIRGIAQKRYRIMVESLKGTVFWDSDWVESTDSFLIKHGGIPLICDEQYYIEISVDIGGEILRKKAFFSTGLFSEDPDAPWIGISKDCDSPLIRTTFFTPKKAKYAYAYVSATSPFRLYINDKFVGGRIIIPPITKSGNYFLDTYDISDKVSPDNNTIGVWLCKNKSNVAPGVPLAACVIISMTYYDGSKKRFYLGNDAIWHESPIKKITEGGAEVYDKNSVIKKWCDPYINTSYWKPACVLALRSPKPIFCPKMGRISTTSAKYFEARDDEVTFCDFGTSAFGRIKMIITGEPGTKIVVTYYDRLKPDGTPDPIDDDDDVYIIKGYEIEAFEPRFSARPFRFAEIRMDGVAQLIYAERINISTFGDTLINFKCKSRGAMYEQEKQLLRLFCEISEKLSKGILGADKYAKITEFQKTLDAPLYFEEELLKDSPKNYCDQFSLFNSLKNSRGSLVNALVANEVCSLMGIKFNPEKKTVYITATLKEHGDDLNIEYLSSLGLIGVYLRRINGEVHEDAVIPVGADAVITLPDGNIKVLTSGKYLYEQN